MGDRKIHHFSQFDKYVIFPIQDGIKYPSNKFSAFRTPIHYSNETGENHKEVTGDSFFMLHLKKRQKYTQSERLERNGT